MIYSYVYYLDPDRVGAGEDAHSEDLLINDNINEHTVTECLKSRFLADQIYVSIRIYLK